MDRVAIGQAQASVNWIGVGTVLYLAVPTTQLGFGLWGHLLKLYPAADGGAVLAAAGADLRRRLHRPGAGRAFRPGRCACARRMKAEPDLAARIGADYRRSGSSSGV